MRTHGIADATTMLRRNLRHLTRHPTMVLMTLAIPVVLLLLFTGIFGGALTTGLGDRVHGGYVDYVVPGILLMTVGYGATTTAMAVNRDMTEGIIDRFRTMAIARTAVLTGHVASAVIRTMISVVLVVAVALLLGFRPAAGPLEWLAALGVIALLALALNWLAVAVGLSARTVEGTGAFTVIVQVLPFVSSAFVTPESMSGAVRWFARHEPFTPVIDTIRSSLSGAEVGGTAVVAVGWCVVLAVAGYLWARAVFRRDPRP
jgi:ABC-2 type transport system permease protein